MQEMPLRIIIVDDHPLFREGIKAFIESELEYKVIADVGSGADFLKLNTINLAQIILMDIEMPDLNGIETSKKILWQYPHLKIIAITMYKDKAYLKELIESGIRGFVHKTGIFSDIEKAIRTVMADKLYFPEDIRLDTRS